MSFEDNLKTLRHEVSVAEDEIMHAVMFHETWLPMAQDNELLARMGTSLATHTFQIVGSALRREEMLSLWKLWDTTPRALSFPSIANQLCQPQFFEELVTYRAKRIGISEHIRPALHFEMLQMRADFLALVNKYQAGGTHIAIKKKLTALRNQRLAHRQKKAPTVAMAELADGELEEFYQDNLRIIELLNHLVAAKFFDMEQASEVYRTFAGNFWAGVRGERTEGHPRYNNGPPTVSLA